MKLNNFMEQENIQPNAIENDKKIKAKLVLKIILALNIVTLVLATIRFNSFYPDGLLENIFISIKNNGFLTLIIFTPIIILVILNFLSYFVARMFYKKNMYIKQTIWGILLIILSQTIIYMCFSMLLSSACFGCGNNLRDKLKTEPIPCISNPGAGIICY